MLGHSFRYLKIETKLLKYLVLFMFGAIFICTSFFNISNAQAQRITDFDTRSLKIYFVQTKEHEEVVFKKNGRYVPSGLKRLSYLLRDWRLNEATNMDPRLFDIVWQIYQLSGSKEYIHVASGYRSPRTNTMLRLRSPKIKVAKNSRHTTGQAMDFYLPDVNIAYLRAIALKLQGGGIGYYPNANSPFVHVDVGTVRHWPRMSKPALAALFPKGQTMHVPTTGKPFSGYTQAVASYKSRDKAAIHAISAHSLFGNMSRRQVILAAADGHLPSRIGRNLYDGSTAPLLAQAEIPVPKFAERTPSEIPLPSAAPDFGTGGNAINDDEIYDIIESDDSIPVPYSKYDATDSNSSNGLMAYAPQPSAKTNGAAEALQALTQINAVPIEKPYDGDNASSDAGKNGYQSLDAKEQALAGIIAPKPHMKPGENNLEQLAFRGEGEEDSIEALIVSSSADLVKHVPLPAQKAKIDD